MEIYSNQETKDNTLVVSPHISLITVSVNRLNSLIKSYRVARWVKKQDPTIAAFRQLISAPKTNMGSK